jgi:hypothetical protein
MALKMVAKLAMLAFSALLEEVMTHLNVPAVHTPLEVLPSAQCVQLVSIALTIKLLVLIVELENGVLEVSLPVSRVQLASIAVSRLHPLHALPVSSPMLVKIHAQAAQI